MFTVAGPVRGDIIHFCPGQTTPPKDSFGAWTTGTTAGVRARNTWRGLSEFFQWLTRTPSHTWLGRTIVVHRPPAATIQNAFLLRVRPGDIVTLLGATTNLLEGSCVVPAVSDATDDAAESEGTLAHLGPVHVSRWLPSGSRAPNTPE